MAMFDARTAAAEHAARHGDEVFEFVGMDGETYYLPPQSTLTARQARRLMAGDFDVLADVATPEACAALDDLPVGVLEELGVAWGEAAEPAGKSGSVSSKTPSSGTQSKRTSRSAASS